MEFLIPLEHGSTGSYIDHIQGMSTANPEEVSVGLLFDELVTNLIVKTFSQEADAQLRWIDIANEHGRPPGDGYLQDTLLSQKIIPSGALSIGETERTAKGQGKALKK